MKYLFAILSFFILNNSVNAQVGQNLDIDFMLRGNIYAQSSYEDENALGGFSESSNSPKSIDSLTIPYEDDIQLLIDDSKTIVSLDSINSFNFYIINNSEYTITFRASDSRLPAYAQVFYQNEWVNIEYLPSSFCGNSYHDVFLKNGQYWSFVIPKFTGEIDVKLRYKIELPEKRYITSNEIDSKINLGQMSIKQGHKSTGVMDPYDD